MNEWNQINFLSHRNENQYLGCCGKGCSTKINYQNKSQVLRSNKHIRNNSVSSAVPGRDKFKLIEEKKSITLICQLVVVYLYWSSQMLDHIHMKLKLFDLIKI